MKKQINHKNTQSCQYRKKNQIEKIRKSKDDSSRMFKAIKDWNKMKPKTSLVVKEGNQYTENKKR